jgi:hypothetical protein
MDNRCDLPGYKYYTDPDGARPSVFVVFLDLRAGGEGIDGMCAPVDAAMLRTLDLRERNYDRIDVTERIELGERCGKTPARVWTYVGSQEGRRRLADARRDGCAVVQGDYLRAVARAIAALHELGCSGAVPPLDGLVVREMIRHDLSDVIDGRGGAPGGEELPASLAFRSVDHT